MLDTRNISTSLLKKFELGFGFAAGEHWFGFVVCNEKEDTKRIRSGTFEGELVLISKRTLPRRKIRVNSKNQEITLLDVDINRDGSDMSIDVNRGGSDMSIIIPYTVRVTPERRAHMTTLRSLCNVCANGRLAAHSGPRAPHSHADGARTCMARAHAMASPRSPARGPPRVLCATHTT